MPVWFVDTVELTSEGVSHTMELEALPWLSRPQRWPRRTSTLVPTELAGALKDLGLGPEMRHSSGPRKLSQGDVWLFEVPHRTAVTRARAERDQTEREREEAGQQSWQESSTSAAADDIVLGVSAPAPAPAVADVPEVCAVCLDAPRDAFIKPCGHISTCLACAKKLMPQMCVTCRGPIEAILPWRDL